MRAGRFVFAAILIALGGWCVVRGSLSPVWGPGPVALVYPCAAVSIACGAGLLWKRTSRLAARVLLAALAIWIAVFRVRDIVRAPGVFGSWDGCAETLAITSAAAALAFPSRAWIARVLLGLCMIPFGLAHLIYAHETATLVPSWLPAHLAWAYATGGAFFAAGAALLAGVRARIAAALAAAQMGAGRDQLVRVERARDLRGLDRGGVGGLRFPRVT